MPRRQRVRGPRSVRFPLEPLLGLLAETTDADTAERLGVSVSTVRGWRQGRRVTLGLVLADRYAVRLGLHPANVWDDWLTIDADRGVAS